MKEAQSQPAGAVTDATQELATSAECDLGKLHFALDDRTIAVAK